MPLPLAPIIGGALSGLGSVASGLFGASAEKKRQEQEALMNLANQQMASKAREQQLQQSALANLIESYRASLMG